MSANTKLTLPTLSLMNMSFIYTPSGATDVTKTWAKAGWAPGRFHG